MSYQAANFNRNQQAIRSMHEIAAGVNETVESTASVAPIRYAKDLVASSAVNSSAVSQAQTVDTADHTAQAQAQPSAAAHASDNSNHAQTQFSQHQTYEPTQKVDASASKNDLDIAAVMWLSSLIFLMIPGMLVLLNNNATPYLKQQAREALNWTITFVLGSIICTILTLVFIGGPLQILLSVAHVVFCLLGANAARKGNTFRVPMSWRPLQD